MQCNEQIYHSSKNPQIFPRAVSVCRLSKTVIFPKNPAEKINMAKIVSRIMASADCCPQKDVAADKYFDKEIVTFLDCLYVSGLKTPRQGGIFSIPKGRDVSLPPLIPELLRGRDPKNWPSLRDWFNQNLLCPCPRQKLRHSWMLGQTQQCVYYFLTD